MKRLFESFDASKSGTLDKTEWSKFGKALWRHYEKRPDAKFDMKD